MLGSSQVRLSLLLLPFLLIAGRQARAADVVVDNDSGAPGYVESGPWTTSTSTGYLGGTYRFTNGVSGAPTSSARSWSLIWPV